jgi:hypothetical protein
MKIKVSENGFWISDDWLYLDTKDIDIDKVITYDEFYRNFDIPLKYDKEWKGNNPFSKSQCLRLWLENEKAMVEICVFTYQKSTKITIHKVIVAEDNSKQLIVDLLDLEELYRDTLISFENYLNEYVYNEEDKKC